MNPDLHALGPYAALLYAGLWTIADRQGRLKDSPSWIKAMTLPYYNLDIQTPLNALASGEDPFIVRYVKDGKRYIQIVNFTKHQNPHVNEAPSTIPAPDKHSASTVQIGLIPDSVSLIPDSGLRIPDVPKPDEASAPLSKPKPKPKSKAVEPEKPYEVPLPESDPLGALVVVYKVLKDFKFDDRAWDRDNYGRVALKAKLILDVLGDFKLAVRFLESKAEWFKKTGKDDWRIDWVVPDAHEYKKNLDKKLGRNDEAGNRQGLSFAVDERRAAERRASGGGFASAKQIIQPVGVENGGKAHDPPRD